MLLNRLHDRLVSGKGANVSHQIHTYLMNGSGWGRGARAHRGYVTAEQNRYGVLIGYTETPIIASVYPSILPSKNCNPINSDYQYSLNFSEINQLQLIIRLKNK